jgi:hypothetical protein
MLGHSPYVYLVGVGVLAPVVEGYPTLLRLFIEYYVVLIDFGEGTLIENYDSHILYLYFGFCLLTFEAVMPVKSEGSGYVLVNGIRVGYGDASRAIGGEYLPLYTDCGLWYHESLVIPAR